MRAPDRRQFISTGLAISTMSLAGEAATAWPPGKSALLPRFTDSAVVSLFVWALFRATKSNMTPALSDAILGVMPKIVDNLRKLDADFTLSAADLRRVVFLARIAKYVIAPYALRRAGYDNLARACEADPFPLATYGTCAAQLAARTIGLENLRGIKPTTAFRDEAHSACQHAANAQDRLIFIELRCLPGVAQDCAFALGSLHKDDVAGDTNPAAENWVWSIAVAIMQHAMSIS